MINTFKAYLSTALEASGSETTIYLDRITTLTDETVATSHFTTLGRGILTVNPDGDGNISYPEWISFTAVSGTTVTGATRGLSALGNSVVTANKRFHPVGTPVVISFGVHNALDIIDYVDDQVGAVSVGTANVVLGTAGETITAGQLVYLKNDGKWWKTDADTASTVDGVQLGIAQGAGSADGAITGGVMLHGLDTHQTGLSAGTTYYAGNTAGAIASSAGTTEKAIGVARSATTIYFEPNYVNLPTATEKDQFSVIDSLTGMISPYAGRSAPTGWLICDGSAVSRTTYADLFSVIAPSQTFTVTQASPAVFSATTHGLVVGDKISLTTTGGLLSGLATNTDYYVISAGLTADAFEVSLVPGGAAVNTTGSQSGTHTMYKNAWGKGDGSTTFNIPDLRSRTPIGKGATAPTYTLTFEDSQVNTGTDVVTILDTVFPAQGQAVALTTTGTLPTGLSATTYYIIRASTTTIKFATSQANANAGTAVDITAASGGGVHTLTFTMRAHTILGLSGGEEKHGISDGELASHLHSAPPGTPFVLYGGSGIVYSGGSGASGTQDTTVAGSDSPHNNMSPFVVTNWIIKY